MLSFNKERHKHISEHEVSKHDYVIWYLNNQLSPLITEIRKATRNIYIKQEAARVFPSGDNSYLAKLNLTILGLRTHLTYLLEEYDKEKNEVIKMIDKDNLEIAYPAEGYELVQFEVERILEGK